MTYEELTEFVNAHTHIPDWIRGTALMNGPHWGHLLRWQDHEKLPSYLRSYIRKLPIEQQRDLLRSRKDRLSPKLARWIYQNLSASTWEVDRRLNDKLLFYIAVSDHRAPWKNGFFWHEIDRFKMFEYGANIIQEMNCMATTYNDSPKFVHLYHDKSAHPIVRGEAVFALFYTAPYYVDLPYPQRIQQKWRTLIRETCLEALSDRENPYARAGGCFLAQVIDGFEREVEALLTDHTPSINGSSPVSECAKEALANIEDRANHEK